MGFTHVYIYNVISPWPFLKCPASTLTATASQHKAANINMPKKNLTLALPEVVAGAKGKGLRS